MKSQTVSFDLPSCINDIIIDEQSPLIQLRTFDTILKGIAHNIETNLTCNWDLGKRVHLIYDTLANRLPEVRQERTKDIIFACLKTAILVALIAGTVFSAFFLETPLIPIFSGLASIVLSYIFYFQAQENFIFPQRRIQEEKSLTPWFCPDLETVLGKLAVASVIWPTLGGLFLPLIEACTRKSRWENILDTQKNQIDDEANGLLLFYDNHYKELLKRVQTRDALIQSHHSSDEKPGELLKYIKAQCEFLESFRS